LETLRFVSSPVPGSSSRETRVLLVGWLVGCPRFPGSVLRSRRSGGCLSLSLRRLSATFRGHSEPDILDSGRHAVKCGSPCPHSQVSSEVEPVLPRDLGGVCVLGWSSDPLHPPKRWLADTEGEDMGSGTKTRSASRCKEYTGRLLANQGSGPLGGFQNPLGLENGNGPPEGQRRARLLGAGGGQRVGSQ